MTLFAIHNEDGEIHQANKVYSPEGYADLLREQNLTFVEVENTGLIRPGIYYVRNGELTERPDLPVTVNKTKIKAGSEDSALFQNIPEKAKVTVSAVGATLHTLEPLDATELEISIPVVCTYTVKIDLWPYKTYTQDIEAVNG